MHRIVFRADDAGSSAGANAAIEKTVREGVVRNVSVMAPGPAFEHAASMLRNLGEANIGLHVTLNAEWDRIKWGPVAGPDRVPSLVDSHGYLTPSPRFLNDRGFSLDEAMLEVEAQLRRLREAGLEVVYLDQHMGVGWIEGLQERLSAFCEREGLFEASRVPYLDGAKTEDVDTLLRNIQATSEEPHVVVTHPGSDNDQIMHEFTYGEIQPGAVLAVRAQERKTLTDPRLKAAIQSQAIATLTYLEAARFFLHHRSAPGR